MLVGSRGTDVFRVGNKRRNPIGVDSTTHWNCKSIFKEQIK